MQLFTCQNCGEEKEDLEFDTDFGSQPEDEMTCEDCYDAIDEGLI